VRNVGALSAEPLMWSVDHHSHFRGHLYVDGWAYHPHARVRSMSVLLPDGQVIRADGYGLASPDIQGLHGDGAERCRFSLRVAVPNAHDARQASLVFRLSHGPDARAENLSRNLGADPFNRLYLRFHEMVRSLESPTVVEVGSRARSGNLHVGWLPEDSTYRGFDVIDGPNVDVVGDAHKISQYFPNSSVDAIFSLSTMEHLAMPWKAVVEMNSILRSGGLVFAATHQTWPVHDAPWDFWRFSSFAWAALFNESTGFEILDVAMGERASVVADFLTPSTAGLDEQPAFLGSAVIAKKVGPTSLDWDVDLRRTTDADYPA
jgi:SAM-dependent methyltransferase